MLTNDQLYVLNLLRRSFDISCDDIKPENISNIKDIILQNGILLTVYPIIKAMGMEANELESALRSNYFATLHQAAPFLQNELAKNMQGEDGFICKTYSWEKGYRAGEAHVKKRAERGIA